MIEKNISLLPKDLARRGFYLFPCGSNKKPMTGIKWKDMSTTDIDQIRKWSERYPGCWWGVDCGKSGFAVLDNDRGKKPEADQNLFNLQCENGDLPDTFKVDTPSGGYHAYFAGEIKTTVETIGKGLDSRGIGGYVIAPCSEGYTISNDIVMQPVPQWLADKAGQIIDRKETAAKIPTAASADEESNIKRAIVMLSKADPAIEGKGGDKCTFRIGCEVRDLGISQDTCYDLMEEYFNPRCIPPWTADELKEKIRNSYTYPKNTFGNKDAANVFTAVHDISDEFIQDSVQIDPQSPYALASTTTELKLRDDRIEYVVEGLIPRGMITLFYAPSGMGKSTLCTQLVQAICDGSPFLGRRTSKTEVFYLDYENPVATIVERLQKVVGVEPFKIWHSAQDPPPPPIDKSKREILFSLRPGTVLVIDTLKAANDKDENDATAMKPIFDFLKNLRNHGLTIILLHHTNKGLERNYRGSGVIQDQSDHVLTMIKVRAPGSDKETEDESSLAYKLYTPGKTRAKPSKMFLAFDPSPGLFIATNDPVINEIDMVKKTIAEIIENGESPTQSRIIEALKTFIGGKKLISLLKHGTDKFWNISHGEHNATIYNLLSAS